MSENIVKNLSTGQQLAVAEKKVSENNETWFVLGDSGMVANAYGRRGWEQFTALAFHPDGTKEIIEASPRA